MSTETTPPGLTVAVFLLDSNWLITAVNRKAERLAGLYSRQMTGRLMKDIFCPSREECPLTELLINASEGHTITKHPVLLENLSSGGSFSVLASVIPLPSSDKDIAGILITLQDTTDQALMHHLLLDSIAEGVLTVNTSLEITSFNRAAEQMTGWASSEVIGKKCKEIFPPEICGKNCLIKASIDEERQVIAQSVFMTNKDGHVFALSLTSAPLYGSNDKVIGGVQTFRDTTDAVNNNLILSSVADGVFTVDNNGIITSFNRSAEHISGWSRDEAIGKPCREVFHSSICGEECNLLQSINNKEPYANDSVFIRAKDGTSVPVSISSAPLIDDFGNTIGGIETFRDNTHSIRDTMIFDSIADGVFTVDRNWKITSFNRAAEYITGWPRQDAMGRSCSDIFHSSICGKNCAIAESLYTGAPVCNRSITIRDHEGNKIPISISAAPLTDHEGHIIGGVETFRDLTTITSLRQELTQKYTFDEIISKSAAMQRLFAIMPDIARSPSTVLILGESGTGKELVARALFHASERKDKPFVVVNCGALPETLLESELFGYKAGAFTDARKDKQGRFAAAEGGTLFLDEIGEIPGKVQVKLLRVLQDRVYEPLGSNAPVKADVRIVTATNRDLQSLVDDGDFRDDLFYRLNVVKINLPPLRERKEDIPLLAEHFIKKYCALQGKDIVGISNGALTVLMRHDYPGNIRELENIIEYAFILCDGGYIQLHHLPEPFAPGSSQEVQGVIQSNGPQTLEDMEKQTITLALERNRWKKMVTCRELGVSKDTLRRKIAKYRLSNPLEESQPGGQ